jgi:hypothetical protein
MEDEPPQPEPLTFHEWTFLGTMFSGYALAIDVFVLGGNEINDFLMSPIGIKEHPPEPGMVVQYAQMAFWPLVISFAILWALMKLTEIRDKTKD